MTTHMLTFDVEEFYQVEAARRAGVSPQMWAVYDSRLDVGLDSICELLDAADVRATFFILGEVARRRGDWVKRLAAAGHEIASHGMTHTMLTQLSPEAAAAELRDSKALLEELVTMAKGRGFHTVLAHIAGGHEASIALHHSVGFAVVGVQKEVGRKFGTWLDVTVMQHMLG